jgi:hypothetical protein
MKPNVLFPILFIQNNLKKNQVPTFFIRLLHMCILEKLIFVTQLVAKHMKEIINKKNIFVVTILVLFFSTIE